MAGEVKLDTVKDIILTQQKKSIVISSKSIRFLYDASNIKTWSMCFQECGVQNTANMYNAQNRLLEEGGFNPPNMVQYQQKLRMLVSSTSKHTPNKMGTDLMVHTVLLEALRMVLVTEIFENNNEIIKKNNNQNSTNSTNPINIDDLNLTPVKNIEQKYVRGGNNITEVETEVDGTIYDRLKVIETGFLNYLEQVNKYLEHQTLSYTLSDANDKQVQEKFWINIYDKFREEIKEAKDEPDKQWNIFFFLNEIQSMVKVSYSVGDTGRRSRNKKLCYDIIYLTALLFGQDITPEDTIPEDQVPEVPDLLEGVIDIQPPSKKPKIADSPSKSPSKMQLKKYLRF